MTTVGYRKTNVGTKNKLCNVDCNSYIDTLGVTRAGHPTGNKLPIVSPVNPTQQKNHNQEKQASVDIFRVHAIIISVTLSSEVVDCVVCHLLLCRILLRLKTCCKKVYLT